jgi:hypothetical protein
MFNRDTQAPLFRACCLFDRDVKVSYETFLKALSRQNNSLNLNVYYTTSLRVTYARYIIYEARIR